MNKIILMILMSIGCISNAQNVEIEVNKKRYLKNIRIDELSLTKGESLNGFVIQNLISFSEGDSIVLIGDEFGKLNLVNSGRNLNLFYKGVVIANTEIKLGNNYNMVLPYDFTVNDSIREKIGSFAYSLDMAAVNDVMTFDLTSEGDDIEILYNIDSSGFALKEISVYMKGQDIGYQILICEGEIIRIEVYQGKSIEISPSSVIVYFTNTGSVSLILRSHRVVEETKVLSEALYIVCDFENNKAVKKYLKKSESGFAFKVN